MYSTSPLASVSVLIAMAWGMGKRVSQLIDLGLSFRSDGINIM